MPRPPWRPPELLIRALWSLGDAAAWFVAVVFTVWLRHQYDAEKAFVPDTWVVAGAAGGIHVLAGLLVGPYLVKHVRGSFEEVLAVARAALITAVALGIWAIFIEPYVVPRSVPAVGGAVALTVMMAGRFVVRSFRSRRAVRRDVDNTVIIYGAGVLGRRLVANMVQDDQAAYRPVAFLDDDRAKRRLKIDGVPVRGGLGALARVAKRHDATHLAVAIPQADAALMREVKAE